MHAVRATHAFDGRSFLPGGATVVVEHDGTIVGVEAYDHPLPDGCPVTSLAGTLLPGLIECHTHLVTDSGPAALGRVAGYSAEEIDAVVTRALQDQLAAGVTTVRDLGDRRFCVVERRDRQRRDRERGTAATEPRIVASGPPITTVGGHCHFLGGEVAGPDSIVRAVDERAAHGVDVVKVMASGGVNTPGSDVQLTQFSAGELALVVDRAHAAGLPVTAHAHGLPAVEQAIAVGVDGIEHCSCLTDRGFGRVDDQTLEALARGGITVCPTMGVDPLLRDHPPPAIRAMLEQLGTTSEQARSDRHALVGRLHRAGVRVVAGIDSGINPGKRHGLLPLEVGELVASGLPVVKALEAATSGAAEACGLGDRTGRLAPGLDADLLVVDGSLEDDLSALDRPLAVLVRGEVVSRRPAADAPPSSGTRRTPPRGPSGP